MRRPCHDPASHACTGVRVQRGGTAAGAHLATLLAVMALVLTATGCASGSPSGGTGSSTSASTGLMDRALQAVGLTKPPLPETPGIDVPKLSRTVALRLHAGEVLNTDGAGRSLAVVARIYKLRDSAAFLQVPYEALQSASPPKDAVFQQDVLEVREVVLTPGTRHEVMESVPPEARFVAVVALFRAPAPTRWRFVFDARAAAATGITLGLHSCAISVAQGTPVNATPESQRLAGVQCRG